MIAIRNFTVVEIAIIFAALVVFTFKQMNHRRSEISIGIRLAEDSSRQSPLMELLTVA